MSSNDPVHLGPPHYILGDHEEFTEDEIVGYDCFECKKPCRAIQEVSSPFKVSSCCKAMPMAVYLSDLEDGK